MPDRGFSMEMSTFLRRLIPGRCWSLLRTFALPCAFLTMPALGALPGDHDKSPDGIEMGLVDPSKAPNATEWRRFMEMPAREIEALWYSNAHRGNTLASWDWKWRLGWVRVCAVPSGTRPGFCGQLLESGLQDKALVVRAEAAGAIGTTMEGSMDAALSRKLLATLRDRRNTRGGVPVMVQKRALYSIFKIGHSDSLKEAAAIAARTPELKAYWEKLTST